MTDPSSTDEQDAVRESLDELRHAESRLERRRQLAEQPTEIERLALRYVVDRAALQQAATPGELAQHLGVPNPKVTRLLQRLEASGVVETLPHPTDRRSKVVVPIAGVGDGESMPAAVRELIGRRSTNDARAISDFLEDLRDLVDRTDSRET